MKIKRKLLEYIDENNLDDMKTLLEIAMKTPRDMKPKSLLKRNETIMLDTDDLDFIFYGYKDINDTKSVINFQDDFEFRHFGEFDDKDINEEGFMEVSLYFDTNLNSVEEIKRVYDIESAIKEILENLEVNRPYEWDIINEGEGTYELHISINRRDIEFDEE